jgi:class 3 adenylate cyclase
MSANSNRLQLSNAQNMPNNAYWKCQQNQCVYNDEQQSMDNSNNNNNKELRSTFTSLVDCHNRCQLVNANNIPSKVDLDPIVTQIRSQSTQHILGTVLFSDIRGSSVLWSRYPESMYAALIEHEVRMQQFAQDFQAVVIKSIGDAFMLIFPALSQLDQLFPIGGITNNTNAATRNSSSTTNPPTSTVATTSTSSTTSNNSDNNNNNNNNNMLDADNVATLRRAVEFAVTVQEDLRQNPILVGNQGDRIRIRIGIAYGAVYYRSSFIQRNIRVVDVFGNTVNTASRAESKVSQPDGFAFAIVSPTLTAETALSPEIDSDAERIADQVIAVIPPNEYHLIQDAYLESCPAALADATEEHNTLGSTTRSRRLITFECHNITELRGVSQSLIYNAVPTM